MTFVYGGGVGLGWVGLGERKDGEEGVGRGEGGF